MECRSREGVEEADGERRIIGCQNVELVSRGDIGTVPPLVTHVHRVLFIRHQVARSSIGSAVM
jgi:hypothetical protein